MVGLVRPPQTVTTGLQSDTRLYTVHNNPGRTLGRLKVVCSELSPPDPNSSIVKGNVFSYVRQEGCKLEGVGVLVSDPPLSIREAMR